MEFAAIVYLVGTVLPLLSGVGEFAIIVMAIVGVAWIFGVPFWLDEDYEDSRKSFFKITKTICMWAIPIAFVCGLVPSKEVSYTMIAAYTAQSIGENEKVQNIAGQSLEVIEAFLAKTKEELQEKSEK